MDDEAGLSGGKCAGKPLDPGYIVGYLARFYGWSHEYILGLRSRLFFMYYEIASRLTIEEHLRMIEAACIPNTENANEIIAKYKFALRRDYENVEESWNTLRKQKHVHSKA